MDAAHAIGLPRLAAIAMLAQALGHLSLMMAPSGDHVASTHGGAAAAAHLSLTPTMLSTHVIVAIAAVAVAGGLDTAVLAVLRAAAGWLLPVLSAAQVPSAHRASALSPVRRLQGCRGPRSARPRGPPATEALLPTLRAAY